MWSELKRKSLLSIQRQYKQRSTRQLTADDLTPGNAVLVYVGRSNKLQSRFDVVHVVGIKDSRTVIVGYPSGNLRYENVTNLLPLRHYDEASEALEQSILERETRGKPPIFPDRKGQRLSILIKDTDGNYAWYDGTVIHHSGKYIIIEWEDGQTLEKLNLEEEVFKNIY
jgi:hypothetical protein